MAGSWLIANHLTAPLLRLGLVLFVLALGCYLLVGAIRQIHGL